jgi:hypothetical protein
VITRRRTRSRVVRIEVGRRSAWLHGAGLAAALDQAGIPRMWCPFHKALTCPVDRVDDLLALLEFRDGRVIDLQAVDR